MITLARALATAIHAIETTDRQHLTDLWADYLTYLEKTYLPSGSGFNSGSCVDMERSTKDKVVVLTSFHHASLPRARNRWTDHSIILTPSLIHGVDVKITGKNVDGVKEYIALQADYFVGRQVETLGEWMAFNGRTIL